MYPETFAINKFDPAFAVNPDATVAVSCAALKDAAEKVNAVHTTGEVGWLIVKSPAARIKIPVGATLGCTTNGYIGTD